MFDRLGRRFEPLEGSDTLDVLLDKNDSVHIRAYPLSWISTPVCRFLCYNLSRFLFKIDMLTCRSVQAAANHFVLCRFVLAILFDFIDSVFIVFQALPTKFNLSRD